MGNGNFVNFWSDSWLRLGEFRGTFPPMEDLGTDHICWAFTANGEFSTKTAYHLAAHSNLAVQDPIWKIIWSWRGKFANMICAPFALVNPSLLFMLLEIVREQRIFGLPWELLLGFPLLLHGSSNMAGVQFVFAMHKPDTSLNNHPNLLIRWTFPVNGCIKCNVDASVISSELFRDNNGTWLEGFVRNLGSSSVNMAELWAIYITLVMARKLNFNNIWIESDSIVQETRILMAHLNFDHTHTFREGNRAADWLASYALQFDIGVHHLIYPRAQVVQLLKDDISGVYFYRGFPS
ncbi:Ribonuclease H-like superfamily [Sesbania bispinosa]|nr:Ribonuclease H-like superfamily [Sesbania bispinosa]